MASFNAIPPKSRGSDAKGSVAVAFAPGQLFRTSARVIDPVPYDDEFLHKIDDSLIVAEERPPALQYSWQVCSSNTFTCSDSSVSAQAIQEQVKDIIRKSPADVSCSSEWEFDVVFYPQQKRTAFTVSIFENGSDPKSSCLLEMQLQEGDRVAFQGLVSHVRSQAKLKYAFAEQWGFEKEEEEEFEFEASDYKHTSFASLLLPLPSSLLATSPFIDDSNPLAEFFSRQFVLAIC